jgi:hypothetical protein
VKAADCSTCDGDEREREQLAREDRSRPIHKPGDRWELQWWQHQQDAEREQEDGADLHEGRQVVARAEQHPDRQYAGKESVCDHPVRDRQTGIREVGRHGRRLGHVAAAHQGHQQQRNAEGRGLEGSAWPPDLHPETHQHGDWNRAEDGKHAPGTVLEGVDDHQREHGEENHHDGQHRYHREQARDGSGLLLGHLPQGLAIAAHRAEQDDEVLYRSAQHHPEDEPDRSG